MRVPSLDERLLSVARLVRQGAQFADIGTDHAYLPLWLLAEGKIERAICSDINEGPLQSAKENARECGLLSKVSFFLTDGAAALSSEGITDIAIAGMGGELIASIIEGAPFLKDSSIRLILQPMTKQEHLRRYLANYGFAIADEVYSYSQCKYYVTICAHYEGNSRDISDVEATFGNEKFHTPPTKEARGYFSERIRAITRRRDGLIAAGEDASAEEKLIEYAQEVLSQA